MIGVLAQAVLGLGLVIHGGADVLKAPMSTTTGYPTTSAAIQALGLPAPGVLWLGSDPLHNQIGKDETPDCTAEIAQTTNTTPFCADGVTPTTCQDSTLLLSNSRQGWGGYVFDFANPIGQVSTGSFSACFWGRARNNEWGVAQFLGTFGYYQYATQAGWAASIDGSDNWGCRADLSDATDRVYAHAGTVPSGQKDFCCITLDKGAAKLLTAYSNGTAGTGVDVTAIDDLSNNRHLVVGGRETASSVGVADMAGAWVWADDVLTSANVTALWTKVSTSGLGTSMPPGVPTPDVVWLSANPGMNSLDSSQSTTISTALKGTSNALPYCGTSQNTGNCLVSQVFAPFMCYPGACGAGEDVAQHFHCGDIGNNGSGTDSPANDFSVCAVYKNGSNYSRQAVVSRATGYYSGWISGQGMYDETTAGDSAVIMNPGMLLGTGPVGANTNIAYNGINITPDGWVVACDTFLAEDGTSYHYNYSCHYHNGMIGYSPMSGASEGCDGYAKESVLVSAPFTIGGVGTADNSLYYPFSGEIVEVVWWNSRITPAQVYAFTAPWLKANTAATTRNVSSASQVSPGSFKSSSWKLESTWGWSSHTSWSPKMAAAGVYSSSEDATAIVYPIGSQTVGIPGDLSTYGVVDGSGNMPGQFRVLVTWTPNVTSISSASAIWQYDDGTTSNRLRLYIDTSKRLNWCTTTGGGAETCDIQTAALTLVAGTPIQIDFRGDYVSDAYVLTVGGVPTVSTTARVSPTGLINFRLGADETGATQVVGGSWIKNVRIAR